MIDYETRIAAIADKYDDPDELLVAALRRRAYRLRHGGKFCQICERDLPVAAFARDTLTRDCLRRYCRDCDAARYRRRKALQEAAT